MADNNEASNGENIDILPINPQSPTPHYDKLQELLKNDKVPPGDAALYRQRGQLKLDNSVIEEFLPRLVDPDIIPGLAGKKYEPARGQLLQPLFLRQRYTHQPRARAFRFEQRPRISQLGERPFFNRRTTIHSLQVILSCRKSISPL